MLLCMLPFSGWCTGLCLRNPWDELHCYSCCHSYRPDTQHDHLNQTQYSLCHSVLETSSTLWMILVWKRGNKGLKKQVLGDEPFPSHLSSLTLSLQQLQSTLNTSICNIIEQLGTGRAYFCNFLLPTNRYLYS
jgi:hypothetical protein